MKIRSLIATTTGLALYMAVAGVQAQIIDYDLIDGSGADAGTLLVDNGSSMDLNDASAGAALDIGPFGAPIAVGDTFTFTYQSFVDLFTGGTPSNPTNLVTTFTGGALTDDDFQVTSVASIEERVSSIAYINTNTGAVSGDLGVLINDGSTSVGDNIQITSFFEQTGTGTISLFYDDADLSGTILDRVAGTGYDDGTEIARFTSIADEGLSSFTVNVAVTGLGADTGVSSPDQGTGSTNQYEFEITAATDFVNADYLIGFDQEQLIYDLRFTGTQDVNQTSGDELPVFTPTAFFVGGSAFYPDTPVSSANDVIFQVDAAVQLSTRTEQVPEPSIIALLSLGLLGAGFMGRRRRV